MGQLTHKTPTYTHNMTNYQAEQPAGVAVLADESPEWDDGPFEVAGVALEPNITTNGNAQGKTVEWPETVVKSAAPQFEGAKITDGSEHDPETAIQNPQPSVDTILGEITEARYEPGTGVVYRGEIDDPEVARQIQRGRVEVSPTIFRTVEDGTVSDVKGVRDLSVVAEGQVPGNEIRPATAASASALRDLVAEALNGSQSVAGVEFDDTGTGQLDESKLDPEEHDLSTHYLYGDGEDKEDYSYPVVGADGTLRRGNVDAAHSLGCRGMCDDPDRHDKRLMELAAEFETPPEWFEAESMADVSDVQEGTLVKWNSSGDRPAFGKVEEVRTKGEDPLNSEIDGDQKIEPPAALIEVHTPGSDGWEASGTMVGHTLNTDTLKVIDELPDPSSLSVIPAFEPEVLKHGGDVPDEFVFDNPGEAVQKAEEMGFGEGSDMAGDELIHTHGSGEDTIFMPGPSHDELLAMLEDTESMSDGGGDDGPPAQAPTDPGQVDATTLSDSQMNVSDSEKALLEAVNDPERAAEVLREYQTAEEPTIVEQSEIETLEAHVESVEALADERLIEDKGLSEATVEAMSTDAKLNEFRAEDGSLEAESLIQTPETGTPGEELDEEVDVESLAAEWDLEASDKDDLIETLRERYERFDRAGWEANAEQAKDRLERLGVEV